MQHHVDLNELATISLEPWPSTRPKIIQPPDGGVGKQVAKVLQPETLKNIKI